VRGEVLEVQLDRFPRFRGGLLNGGSVGNAAGQQRYEDCVTSLGLWNQADLVEVGPPSFSHALIMAGGQEIARSLPRRTRKVERQTRAPRVKETLRYRLFLF